MGFMVLFLNKEHAYMLLDMLTDYLNEHEHDIANQPDEWKTKVKFVEFLRKCVNQWFEKGLMSDES